MPRLTDREVALAIARKAWGTVAGAGMDSDDTEIDVSDEYGNCTHAKVMVDENKRRTFCKICRADMDPFNVVLGYAKAERTFASARDKARAQYEELVKEIANLKRERDHLMGVVRRRRSNG